jgi:hypothetical protein
MRDRSVPSWPRLKEELPRILTSSVVVVAPFVAATVFGIYYYGAWIPNTAYARFLWWPLSVRLFVGIAYVWNYLWSSRSIVYLPALALLGMAGSLRHNRVTLLVIGATIVGLGQLVHIGGDVAWKPFFRLAHLISILVIMLYVISPKVRETYFHLPNIALVVVLTSLLQPGALSGGNEV